MFRSIITEAIVMRRERLGEYHKSLSLLTPDLGLISAVAYGAYKMQSRLRMASEPFTYSRIHLYHNPVKRTYKVTEMEAREDFQILRADLARLSTASFWAEVVLRSYGAGETTPVLFSLVLDCLRALSAGQPDAPGAGPPDAPGGQAADTRCVMIQFLWRFLELAGYRPDAAKCESCAGRFESGAFYEPSSNSFLCGPCSLSSSRPVSAGALRYLSATQELALAECFKVTLDKKSLAGLESAMISAVRAVLEGELKSYRVLGAVR